MESGLLCQTTSTKKLCKADKIIKKAALVHYSLIELNEDYIEVCNCDIESGCFSF
jgi:hypothetical protein